MEKGLHLGFIVDGNRRWARERMLPTLEGHRKGLKKIEELIEFYGKRTEVKYLSLFVFSTENWGRSETEVSYLMKLFYENIGKMAKKMKENNLKCVFMGSKERLEEKMVKTIKEAEELTAECTGMTVVFCFNYGGRQEIVDAVWRMKEDLDGLEKKNGILEKIDEKEFGKYLYCPEIPDVDMVVRTSGEERISGFLLWRAAYAEFLFVKKYFPDLEKADFEEILKEYANRNRRFGK